MHLFFRDGRFESLDEDWWATFPAYMTKDVFVYVRAVVGASRSRTSIDDLMTDER